MLDNLHSQVIVITGAGGGIGRAIAVAMAKEGAILALCGGNQIDKLELTAKAARESGATVHVLPGNLLDDAFLSSCMDKIHEQTGAIDVLINNAGIAFNAAFEDTTPEQLDRIYQINVRAPFLLCQKALPYLRRSRHAAIVNISSVVGHKGYPQQAAYSATKHALQGFSKALAIEVFEQNIRVHNVSPGSVYTDMIRSVRPDLSPEGMIMPEDIAEAVVFLLKYRSNAVIDEINIHRVGKTPFDV